tara:strand:+ start:2720 stop:3367 length:648 start_codon:yes stop_codon:yes gene_type:complete
MKKIIGLFILLSVITSNAARVNLYEREFSSDWSIYVDRDLYRLEPDLEKKGLPNLREALKSINKILPPGFIKFAQKDGLKIFVSPSRKVFNRTGMFFVPAEDSTFSTGLERIMNKSVVIVDRSIFFDQKMLKYYLIHELAHYYHFNIIGYSNREIISNYSLIKRDPNYKIMYATRDHLEYFAELSAMYFTMKEDLLKMDKRGVILMEKLWGRNFK